MYLTDLLFCDKTQIQTIKYGLNDTFAPCFMNFQTVLMSEVILAKFLLQKIYPLGPVLSFKVCFSRKLKILNVEELISFENNRLEGPIKIETWLRVI